MKISKSTRNVRPAARWRASLAGLALAMSAVAVTQTPPGETPAAPVATPPTTSTPAPAQSSSKSKTKAAAKSRPGSTTGAQAASAPAAKKAGAAAPGKSAGGPTRYLPNRFAGRAGVYYKAVWGIDSLSVKWAESGELIRFSWRVLDPEKARVLSDKKVEPSLIDPQAGVSLVIPTMEKVGQLRQSQTPEAGRSYWMVFSNKGRVVKRGHRVNVVVGPFRADNLVVD